MASYSSLVQSKFYSAAFNSAIFDGPIRIYFAQFHEALALKIYFIFQQQLGEDLKTARELSRQFGGNIMVMIYPTIENYSLCFDDKNIISREFWDEDVVIGLRGPIEDEYLSDLVTLTRDSIQNWQQKMPLVSPIPVPNAALI